MTDYNTSGCKDCGEQCQGSRCQTCQRIHDQEAREMSFTHYDCPDCGGTTSAPGVTCYKCRGDN